MEASGRSMECWRAEGAKCQKKRGESVTCSTDSKKVSGTCCHHVTDYLLQLLLLYQLCRVSVQGTWYEFPKNCHSGTLTKLVPHLILPPCHVMLLTKPKCAFYATELFQVYIYITQVVSSKKIKIYQKLLQRYPSKGNIFL